MGLDKYMYALGRGLRGVKKALDDPGVKAQLEAQGATIVGSNPAETAAFHRREMAKFKRAVEISGAKMD